MVDIDKTELAEMAAVAFRVTAKADIPEKIWIDGYQGTAFLRATWSDGITAKRIDQLQNLQQLVAAAIRQVAGCFRWRDHAGPRGQAAGRLLRRPLLGGCRQRIRGVDPHLVRCPPSPAARWECRHPGGRTARVG